MWCLATVQSNEGPAGCLVLDGNCHALAEVVGTANAQCPSQVVDIIADYPETCRPASPQDSADAPGR